MRIKGLTIAVPRESMPGESRVAVTPETVSRLVGAGARVRIESGAGLGSFFPDDGYAGAGAELVSGLDQLYSDADVILKVKEPRQNSSSGRHEIDSMRAGQTLICFLHPAAPVNHEMVERLAEKGITAFSLDGVPRMAKTQTLDALSSMSMVAGYKGFLMAADALARFVPLAASAVGTIPPAELLIVGAGVAGLQAAATGKRLGASVRAIDIRPEAREQAGSLGCSAIDPEIPVDLAVGSGGYALELPPKWLARERDVLHTPVASADIVILAALIPGSIAPLLVTDDMVKSMRPGSAIVDIAIDQGGNCAITEAGRQVQRHGVTVIGIQNIPGRLPAAATVMFARNLLNFILYLEQAGGADAARDEVVSGTLVTHAGRIVHAGTIKAMASVKDS